MYPNGKLHGTAGFSCKRKPLQILAENRCRWTVWGEREYVWVEGLRKGKEGGSLLKCGCMFPVSQVPSVLPVINASDCMMFPVVRVPPVLPVLSQFYTILLSQCCWKSAVPLSPCPKCGLAVNVPSDKVYTSICVVPSDNVLLSDDQPCPSIYLFGG